jgi:hypothetical protein
MRHYQLSPYVFLEVFSDDAVMLVSDRYVMVKINRAAAQLYDLASTVTKDKPFTRDDVLNFLLDNYDVSRNDAELQLRSLLGFGLRHGVVSKRVQTCAT